MNRIGAYEAKTHLPRLLEQVARGERITITKHGTPIAMLVPIHPKQKNVRQMIDALMAFAKAHPLGDLSIRAMIDEGRKF